MEIELKDIEIGNKVWCGGDSGFCDDDIETVENIKWKYDKNTGEKYKVIILSENRKFDSRTGEAMNPPLMYYIEKTEQNGI
jgi:hypothetical protein